MFKINVISTVWHEKIKPYAVSIVVRVTATKSSNLLRYRIFGFGMCMNHEPKQKYMTNNQNVSCAWAIFFSIKLCLILISHITLYHITTNRLLPQHTIRVFAFEFLFLLYFHCSSSFSFRSQQPNEKPKSVPCSCRNFIVFVSIHLKSKHIHKHTLMSSC